ncbi:hypothetical protein O1504_02870 [Bacteroides fragilis]|jgi:hypothetical protein|uniref:hypothetical protein n=1 Tax=Bacteroides TaxID=816 RepID=UPI001C8B1396|nr:MULTISPECIES: hypothetical protein [Bacteroides]MBX9091997.1 hypothetical protein [Bacteroides xylanisolvens]MBX9166217.1 hypothetical protein [Bacteroides xylanisolvens]MCZ2588755.1 hypothetical protein [Bacteroides fragilis]
MSKALLIQSYTTLTTGTQGEWNELNMANSYIQGIQTGDILGNVNAQTLNALISGVPSPWARAKLFKYALDTINNPNPSINNGGLLNFYEILYGEWRGLLATIALYPDRIRFSAPVEMNVKGDDYGIASAFGRMLFDDKDVWTNQQELAKNPDAQPFVHLIYYRNQLVGGTSPLTGVFTGVNYSGLGETASDINWYRNGKFEDPTRYLTPQQLQKVFLFIQNLNKNVAQFETLVNSQRGGKTVINLSGFKGMARQWEKEISDKGNGLKKVGPVAQYSGLQEPFAGLFKSDVPVYLKPDFTFTYVNNGDYQTIGDIQELLSREEYVVGWIEPKAQRPKLSDSPVFYLSFNDIQTGETFYFSVPLSEVGIDIFQNKLDSILGYGSSSNTRLTCHITDAGMLSVSLVVEIDGESVTLNDREYNIHWVQNQGKVIAWPNFVSEKWNKYYLFSEFTDTDTEQFLPLYRTKGEILKTIDGQFLTSRYEPIPEEEKQVDIKKLVTFPSGQSDNLPKYNIIASNKPMCGLSAMVRVTGKTMGAGFLMMRQDIVKDLTSVDMNSTAVVGVDFGSNNTCLFYNANDRGAKPMVFGNYRSVLVGRENNDKRAVAENNELLFFTNYPSDNGQLKSWLHEHDSRYIGPNQSEEVAGGVPVNRPNVRVHEMDEFEIKTQAGTLHYNMKWLDNDKGREKKRAFLKSVWLQACAFLYTNRIRPEEIFWSYPGSMMPSDRDELERIYEDLCKITPFGRKPELPGNFITEAEAVCSYAMSQDFGLSSSNMFLGIDVGGSTSDILLIAKNPQDNNKPSLFRESSVRLAAGVFFDVVIKSEQFRQALVDFHEGHNTNVHVENIKDVLTHPDKAPYFLNNIFDQLKTQDEYDVFYDSLAANAKFVFTIPAYVCGLLLFYSGMLIGKSIKENRLGNIEKIDLLPFGKGGRLFHWLRHATSTRTTNDFYNNCVNVGLKLVMPESNLKVTYREEIENDNKTEVARGLCEQKELAVVSTLSDSDICGETGVTFLRDGVNVSIAADEEVTGEQFADEMSNFDFSGVQNFEKYMDLFIDFVSKRTNLYKKADEQLRDELDDLSNRIIPFCTSDPEYKKAARNNKNGDGFHYHQPIIIAEGACFLKSLVRKVFNQ